MTGVRGVVVMRFFAVSGRSPKAMKYGGLMGGCQILLNPTVRGGVT